MQDNTTWISRTDGQPLCGDCVFWNVIIKKCAIRKNGQSSSLYPASCNFYMHRIKGEAYGENENDSPHVGTVQCIYREYDICAEKHCCQKADGGYAVLGEVLHDIGVWGLENKIPVTKIDKLKAIIVRHFD